MHILCKFLAHPVIITSKDNIININFNQINTIMIYLDVEVVVSFPFLNHPCCCKYLSNLEYHALGLFETIQGLLQLENIIFILLQLKFLWLLNVDFFL
jgi:hypothetical protein